MQAFKFFSRKVQSVRPADGKRISAPQPLDPKLLQQVSGGGPKGTWEASESMSIAGPKGTW